MATDRLKVAILFGGRSEEHPVSVKSATEIVAAMDPASYDVFAVGITTRGIWKLCDGPGAEWESGRGRPVVLSPDRNTRGLLVLGDGGCERIGLDLVFPVLHGKLGEDGAIQGLLELAGIPYVGCDIASSALCMDKSLAYGVVGAAGIATPEYRVLAAGERLDPAGLSYPVFVKPARSGSSFGVTKVSRGEDLPGAIRCARQYDSKVLIEQAVAGTEIGCAILGNGEDLIVGELDQIGLSGGFFRIHQETRPEIGSENATITVPADVPAETRRLVQDTARSIYRALGCRGLARVDMFLTADGEVVLNEVNTMPGMTSYSRYPRMMAAAGISPSAMVDRLVSLTLRDAS